MSYAHASVTKQYDLLLATKGSDAVQLRRYGNVMEGLVERNGTTAGYVTNMWMTA